MYRIKIKNMNIPNWASELAIKVCKENGSEASPTITWRRHNSSSSSGTAYYDRAKGIVVRAGKRAPRWEQKLVLLHEIAHWLRPNKESHSPEFWELAFRLYKENKVPIRKAMGREKGYRREAENGYRKALGLKVKKFSNKRKEISRIDKLPKYNVIGIRKDWKGKSWAVSWKGTPGYFKNGRPADNMWRGYKISDGLYVRLLKMGYEIV